MKVYLKNKKINIHVKEISGLGLLRGLTFKLKETRNISFKFNKYTKLSIHSYFVFFPFLVIWLDNQNKIMEFKIVRPFTLRIKPKKSFNKLIEIPLNSKNKKIISYFVGKRKI